MNYKRNSIGRFISKDRTFWIVVGIIIAAELYAIWVFNLYAHNVAAI